MQAKHHIILGGEKMKLRKLAVTASLAAIGLSAALTAPAAYAAEEQFFPVLAYRTGAYAPNGAPWANGYVDYLKLVNANGGVNGVKIIFEECETATPPTAASSATSA
jgi:branched-chain amino acid transport system substrate-binding protein